MLPPSDPAFFFQLFYFDLFFMASTPEGKVKNTVSKLLKSVDGLFYDMPVPGGYGKSTLDYVGCYRGKYFAIETKAPGKKPTDRQRIIIEKMQQAGAAVFVIDGDLTDLKQWIETTTCETTTAKPSPPPPAATPIPTPPTGSATSTGR